jgi:hypothetical protein
MQPTVIRDVGEKPLVLHSKVREPLGELSFLSRALALAELAKVSYNGGPPGRGRDRVPRSRALRQ